MHSALICRCVKLAKNLELHCVAVHADVKQLITILVPRKLVSIQILLNNNYTYLLIICQDVH